MLMGGPSPPAGMNTLLEKDKVRPACLISGLKVNLSIDRISHSIESKSNGLSFGQFTWLLLLWFVCLTRGALLLVTNRRRMCSAVQCAPSVREWRGPKDPPHTPRTHTHTARRFSLICPLRCWIVLLPLLLPATHSLPPPHHDMILLNQSMGRSLLRHFIYIICSNPPAPARLSLLRLSISWG